MEVYFVQALVDLLECVLAPEDFSFSEDFGGNVFEVRVVEVVGT